MKTLCIIGARGGSEGLPDKNIRLLLGKPLIVWTIEQAQEISEIDRLIVSTDSPSIAEIAINAGAEVPFMRPGCLSSPQVGKFQVWQHALKTCSDTYKEKYEILVDLDCTNPLRESSDILKAINTFHSVNSSGVDAVFSVCSARKNPYFNLVEPDKDGALRMSKSTPSRVLRRQDAPSVFEHVASIYVLAAEYVKNANHLLDGHTVGFDIGVEKSFDIDSEFDFQLIEHLMSKRNRSGK